MPCGAAVLPISWLSFDNPRFKFQKSKRRVHPICRVPLHRQRRMRLRLIPAVAHGHALCGNRSPCVLQPVEGFERRLQQQQPRRVIQVVVTANPSPLPARFGAQVARCVTFFHGSSRSWSAWEPLAINGRTAADIWSPPSLARACARSTIETSVVIEYIYRQVSCRRHIGDGTPCGRGRGRPEIEAPPPVGPHDGS